MARAHHEPPLPPADGGTLHAAGPGAGRVGAPGPAVAIVAWVSRQGAVVIQATRDCTVKMVQKATDIAVQVGSRIDTDSASSYRALKGYAHAFVAGVSQVLITYESTRS